MIVCKVSNGSCIDKLAMWLVAVKCYQPKVQSEMWTTLWLLTRKSRKAGAVSQCHNRKIFIFLFLFFGGGFLTLLLRVCRWLPTLFTLNPLNFLCDARALNPSTKRLGWDPLASGDARKHLSPPNAAVHRGRKPFRFLSFFSFLTTAWTFLLRYSPIPFFSLLLLRRLFISET